MYYSVIKHSGHLRTLEKCRKHSSAARVFYISLVFSNARCVSSQCNTWLRLLYLLIIGRQNYNKLNCLQREPLQRRVVAVIQNGLNTLKSLRGGCYATQNNLIARECFSYILDQNQQKPKLVSSPDPFQSRHAFSVHSLQFIFTNAERILFFSFIIIMIILLDYKHNII